MADLSDKLKDLMAARGVMLGAQWKTQHETKARQADEIRQSGIFEIQNAVPGELVGEGDDKFYLVRTDFPLDTVHGNVTLGSILDIAPEFVAFSACDSELEVFEPSTALFMDTETTGLSGGTGTMSFLIGAGYFVEDAFRLEQCFMRDFDDEEPMLRYLDTLFQRGDTVVSFNGKSFDIPLLRTRFISNRLPFRLDAALHYDLVHAARRIWKMRLKDCSLGSIEQNVLGIQREGDVPSYEIPQIWFDYLRTRDARQLQRVFYHHRMDILSLVALTSLISQCLGVPEGEGFEFAEDKLSLLRLHYRQKRYEDTAAHARKLLESETEAAIRRDCLSMLGLAYKRLEDWPRMEEIWSLMMTEFPSEILPRLELAKHYEHRMHELIKAQRICEETLEFMRKREMAESVNWKASGFERRLERIQQKLAKGNWGQGGADKGEF